MLALVGEFRAALRSVLLTQRAGQAALRDLRCHIFEHLQTRALSFFHRQPIGRLMARLTSDVDALQEALSSGLVAIIGDTVTLLGIVGILVWTSPKLSLVTFAVVPVLLGLTFLFRILMRRAYRELRAQIARLNAYLNEAVTGMRIIQIARAEWTSFRGYDAINEAHRDAAFRAIRWDAMLFALVEISNVAVAGILWFGAGQTLEGAVTLGGLIAFIGYVQKFFVPIRDLSQKYTVLQSAMAASERIFGVLDDEDAILSPEQGKPIEAVGARIAFEGVWFAYKGEDWVLRDVSFAVDVGEKLAVVGHTGAGKSTIVQLLLRLYDVQRGRITIDGVDIRDYDLRALRRLFSLVLQDGFLFSGTVRDNVTLRSPEVREVDVAHACDVVGLDRVAGRLEAGLDHEVRERGSNLRPASASSSPSPARSPTAPRCSCSTRPRRTSTRRPRRPCRRRSTRSSRSRPPSWSRTASAPSAAWTGSWCCTRARSSRSVTTSPRAPRTVDTLSLCGCSSAEQPSRTSSRQLSAGREPRARLVGAPVLEPHEDGAPALALELKGVDDVDLRLPPDPVAVGVARLVASERERRRARTVAVSASSVDMVRRGAWGR